MNVNRARAWSSGQWPKVRLTLGFRAGYQTYLTFLSHFPFEMHRFCSTIRSGSVVE
jgi:hypothetical protein